MFLFFITFFQKFYKLHLVFLLVFLEIENVVSTQYSSDFSFYFKLLLSKASQIYHFLTSSFTNSGKMIQNLGIQTDQRPVLLECLAASSSKRIIISIHLKKEVSRCWTTSHAKVYWQTRSISQRKSQDLHRGTVIEAMSANIERIAARAINWAGRFIWKSQDTRNRPFNRKLFLV